MKGHNRSHRRRQRHSRWILSVWIKRCRKYPNYRNQQFDLFYFIFKIRSPSLFVFICFLLLSYHSLIQGRLSCNLSIEAVLSLLNNIWKFSLLLPKWYQVSQVYRITVYQTVEDLKVLEKPPEILLKQPESVLRLVLILCFCSNFFKFLL